MRMRGRRVQCGDSEGMEQVVGRMEEGQGEDVRMGQGEEHCESGRKVWEVEQWKESFQFVNYFSELDIQNSAIIYFGIAYPDNRIIKFNYCYS